MRQPGCGVCVYFADTIPPLGGIHVWRTPTGQRAGVNHFCVSAAEFSYDAVTRRLQQMGAKVEAPEVAGAAEFRDPDGSLIQVMGPRA